MVPLWLGWLLLGIYGLIILLQVIAGVYVVVSFIKSELTWRARERE